MKRDLWIIDSFSWKKPHPPWPCPICNHGILKGDKKTIRIEQSQDTIKARRTINYNKEGNAIFRFAGFLVCTNFRCNEKIAIAGKGVLYSTIQDQPVSINYIGERYSVFFPQYFLPALNIFEIPENVPEKVKVSIEQSFNLYFSDIYSCVNAIRRALEFLMDEYHIDEITLHNRIKKFSEINKEISELLLATKWIGNSGSHGDILCKDDVLDAYEILEYCLIKLYPIATEQRIKMIANEINNKKSVRSKKINS